jgi:hypothetical protein
MCVCVCVCVLLSQPTPHHKKSNVLATLMLFLPHPFYGMCEKGTSISILWQTKDNVFSCHIGHNSTIKKVIIFLFFQTIYLESN